MTWCHLCNRATIQESYFEHLQRYHPTTFFVLYAVNLTPAQMEYVDTFPFYYNDVGDDEGEYESLLQLCNDIGDHKIGVQDIIEVVQVIDKDTISCDDTCPICLEVFIELEQDIYTLNVCHHNFCSDCITQWCQENKICPICKSDLKS